jgi:hypothetical protein
MAMKKMVAAASPDAYVEALDGWRRVLVEEIRAVVRKAARFDEVIKWGNIVYLSNGPVLVIRAEEARVLMSFFRGKQLLSLEPRLKPSGKYDLATLDLREGMTVTPTVVRKLVREAVALNTRHGDPTKL